MADKNEFKTGTDLLISITPTIAGETVSALAQIVAVLYYERGGQKFKFSWHAIDPAEADIAQEAIDEGRTVHQIVLNGETLELTVPLAETDTLKIEGCEPVEVFVELAYLDSAGDKQKAVLPEAEKRNEDDCDWFVGILIKSITEGWL